MRVVTDKKPSLTIQRTNRLIRDDGLTYNEAGKTYNEIGMVYEGLYGEDILPMVSKATTHTARSSTISDFPNTLAVKTYLRGSPIGLLLDLTFNETIVIFL
jgi:hypothetical protein